MYLLDEKVAEAKAHHVCLINCVVETVKAQTVVLINSVVVNCEAMVVFVMGGAVTTLKANMVTCIGTQKISNLEALHARIIGVEIDRARIGSGKLSNVTCPILEGMPILENTRIGMIQYNSQAPPCSRHTEQGLNAFRNPHGIYSIMGTEKDLDGAAIEDPYTQSWKSLQKNKNYIMLDRNLALVSPTSGLRVQDKSGANPYGTMETKLSNGSVRLMGTGRHVQLHPVFVGSGTNVAASLQFGGSSWNTSGQSLFEDDSLLVVFDIPEDTHPFFGIGLTVYVSSPCTASLTATASVKNSTVSVLDEHVKRSPTFTRIQFPRISGGCVRDTSLTITLTAKNIDKNDMSVSILGVCADAYLYMLHDSPVDVVQSSA